MDYNFSKYMLKISLEKRQHVWHFKYASARANLSRTISSRKRELPIMETFFCGYHSSDQSYYTVLDMPMEG